MKRSLPKKPSHTHRGTTGLQGLAEHGTIESGLQAKAKEFAGNGAEIYAKT